MRGPRNSIVINCISLTYTHLINITHDDNFYQALSSNVVISSLDTGMSLTGNVRARKAPSVDYDPIETLVYIISQSPKDLD